MLQLIIDTATEVAFIGLACDGQLMEMLRLPAGLQNSKNLFPSLLDLLSRHSLSPKDLNLIGCGVGPGSYTGIRVGASIAQSMAYALRLPLVGICSLMSFVPTIPGAFAAALDARYGGVYLIKGNFDGKLVQFDDEPQVVALDQMQEALKGIEVIVTPHLKELQEKISCFAPQAKWEDGIPSGEVFAQKIDEYYKSNRFSRKAELKLLYLRKTQVEIERSRI